MSDLILVTGNLGFVDQDVYLSIGRTLARTREKGRRLKMTLMPTELIPALGLVFRKGSFVGSGLL